MASAVDAIERIILSRESQNILILDGALATELEQKTGSTLDTPLWSAEILLNNPSLVKQVHLDYYLAGADVAITSTYQASVRGLIQHKGTTEEQAMEVMRRSVAVAEEARKEAYRRFVLSRSNRRELVIAGSIGPYGAYCGDGSEYTGSYSLPPADMKAFHRGRIAALLEAGADILAIETQPSLEEIRAILELLEEFPQARAWVSCTLRADDANPPCLSDGSSLRDACELVDAAPQVVAVGVNCCSKSIVKPALEEMKKWTAKPLVAYPNSGEKWDAQKKIWYGDATDKTWDEYAKEWIEQGARLIGGCCKTSPADISTLSRSVFSKVSSSRGRPQEL